MSAKGKAFSWRAAARASQRPIRLLNGYGPTEATVTATFYEIAESLTGAIVPIGRPLPQRTVYVLDGQGQRFSVLEALGTPHPAGMAVDWAVQVQAGDVRVPGRLCAARKSEEAIARAQRRLDVRKQPSADCCKKKQPRE